MTKRNQIQLFNDRKVRTVWDSDTEEWYFSVVDTVGILTESENPRRYLSDLKRKLKKEGSEVYENIVQLKLPQCRRQKDRPQASNNNYKSGRGDCVAALFVQTF